MNPRFSIVIPTHDRLHLLRDAIETVQRQAFKNWEVVVFDNSSSQPVKAHVDGLADERIRFFRSDAFLPVTDSWNRAINEARGDYVLLLGDDDGLIPNYFSRVDEIATRFNQPELIYTDFYQFWHPGVAPWEPSGYVIDVRHAFFFVGRNEPFVLSREEAIRAARGSIRLKLNFSFNSQAVIYKNTFLEKLKSDGPVYRSPFPDYYVANVALARSSSTVVVPQPLAVSGVARASFGFTIYNDEEKAGEALLNTKLEGDPVFKEIKHLLLPGPAYNTNFVVAMEYVARAIPELKESVDFARYRRIQLLSAFESGFSGNLDVKRWADVKKQLSVAERVWCSVAWRLLQASKRHPLIKTYALPRLKRQTSMSDFEPMVRHCGKHDFTRVTELYDAFAAGVLS